MDKKLFKLNENLFFVDGHLFGTSDSEPECKHMIDLKSNNDHCFNDKGLRWDVEFPDRYKAMIQP